MKLPLDFTNWLFDSLHVRAVKTPYDHLDGYMERFWLVPYKQPELGTGCGPVKFFERPIAWLLQRFDIAIRLHHILRSDNDRHFHDHPWPYITLVLRHGYCEVTPMDLRRPLVEYTHRRQWITAGRMLYRPAKSWHRLAVYPDLQPWTLFITFKKQQTWGFLTGPDYEKTPYKQYLKEGQA